MLEISCPSLLEFSHFDGHYKQTRMAAEKILFSENFSAKPFFIYVHENENFFILRWRKCAKIV